MAQSDVEAILGKAQSIGNRFYYFGGEMAIDYSKDIKVEFLEFLGGVNGLLYPTIYGVPAFEEAKASHWTPISISKIEGRR